MKEEKLIVLFYQFVQIQVKFWKYPLISMDPKKGTVIFNNNDKKLETNILDGNCKLQWKVDWAMRWFTFDVDFEMYGKDLTESAILSNKICRTLGKTPPNGFAYELFLDEKGEKISKSKGNGISIEQWLKICISRKFIFIYVSKS